MNCVQVASAIRELVAMAGGADQPHILCGDFNSWPDTSVYQLTQDGYLNDRSMAALQTINGATLSDGNVSSTHWLYID